MEFLDLLPLLCSGGLRDWGAVPFHNGIIMKGVKSLSRLPEGSQSIFLTVLPYFVANEEKRNVSRYAVSKDYHLIARTYLEKTAALLATHYPQHRFVPFADASPVKEVLAAARAGLGILGKNHTLITPNYGSFVFIGEIITDLPVDCENHPVEKCGSCGRCFAACPSGVLLDKDFSRSRCLSDVTQQKGELTREDRRLFDKGDLIWGCDRCQDVCPHNQNLPSTYLPEFYEERRPVVTEENVLDGFKERAYSWRGKSVILRNLRYKNSTEQK